MAIDVCLSVVCENGGTCYVDGGMPRCVCPEGYEGTLCGVSFGIFFFLKSYFTNNSNNINKNVEDHLFFANNDNNDKSVQSGSLFNKW